jgi:alginate O-acetyltransferase complex protein AlgI
MFTTLCLSRSCGDIKSCSIVPYLGVFAIFVTFFFVGGWHGQTSEFLFFGVLQGAGVAAVQLYQVLLTQKLGKRRYKELSNHPATIAFSRGLTFTYFAATLLWFWSNWTQLGWLVHRLGLLAIAGCFALIFVAATGLLWAWESARAYLLSIHVHREPLFLSRYQRTTCLTAISVITLVTVLILNAPAPDIVYKGF